MPTMPGAGLVMIKTKFVFGRLETFFDPLARPFNVEGSKTLLVLRPSL